MSMKAQAKMYGYVATMESIKAEIEGMKSANIIRFHEYKELSYEESDFQKLATQLDNVGSKLREIADGCEV